MKTDENNAVLFTLKWWKIIIIVIILLIFFPGFNSINVNVSVSISDEALDGGWALKEIINIQNRYMGIHFVPALLVLGGMGLALHYEELARIYDGVPPILAYGLPVSGKSLAVQIAMSLISEETSIGGYVLSLLVFYSFFPYIQRLILIRL